MQRRLRGCRSEEIGDERGRRGVVAVVVVVASTIDVIAVCLTRGLVQLFNQSFFVRSSQLLSCLGKVIEAQSDRCLK